MIRILSPAEYRVMPWRNGAGTTTEVAVEPPGARMANAAFHWRLSIADVTASGPFSLFPGYERTILLLEGQGMTLLRPEGGDDLTRPLQPKTFPGEWQVTGTLLSGPVRDLNFIAARRRITSRVEVIEINAARRAACPAGATLVGYTRRPPSKMVSRIAAIRLANGRALHLKSKADLRRSGGFPGN